jgi:hypothetical protein
MFDLNLVVNVSFFRTEGVLGVDESPPADQNARVIEKEVGSLIIHTVIRDEPGSVASRFDPMCEDVAACRRPVPQVTLQCSPAGVVAGAVVHRRSPITVPF